MILFQKSYRKCGIKSFSASLRCQENKFQDFVGTSALDYIIVNLDLTDFAIDNFYYDSLENKGTNFIRGICSNKFAL